MVQEHSYSNLGFRDNHEHTVYPDDALHSRVINATFLNDTKFDLGLLYEQKLKRRFSFPQKKAGVEPGLLNIFVAILLELDPEAGTDGVRLVGLVPLDAAF